MAPRVVSALLSLALGAGLALAGADYTCSSDSSCPAWYNASDHMISANSSCVADPMAPQYGYCGYVGATCESSDDCDFGTCQNNVCHGYYGATCAGQSNACLGTLTCGTDGTCGGAGSQCPNGNTDCASQNCVNSFCQAVPAGGMPAGSGCQSGSMCASGNCSNAYTCTSSSSSSAGGLRPGSAAASDPSSADTAPASGASQANARRHRRDMRSHGRVPSRHAASARRCAATGQTACLMGISSGSGLAFECVDTASALESCGGCLPVPGSNETQYADPTAPAGVDCTSLPNVEEVVCQDSRCKILACRSGATVNPDGTACSLSI